MYSYEFKKADIENALYKIYVNERGFKQIEVISFSQGSVNALFKVEYYFDNEETKAPLDFAEKVLNVIYENRDELANQHIPPTNVHLTEVIVSTYEHEVTTHAPITSESESDNMELLKPVLQLPLFRRLLEKVETYIGKPKEKIFEFFNIFTGSDDTEAMTVKKLTLCEQKRDDSRNSALSNSYWVPKCTESGEFEDVQCNSSLCWCVDSDTGSTIPNSMKSRQDLNCDLIKMTNQIKIEYGQKTSSTQAPTTVPTTIEQQVTEQRNECEDADLCQLVFRNDYAGKNCQGKSFAISTIFSNIYF